MSMCFALLETCVLSASCMTAVLSSLSIEGFVKGIFKTDVTEAREIYSASQVNNDTTCCFLEAKLIKPPFK